MNCCIYRLAAAGALSMAAQGAWACATCGCTLSKDWLGPQAGSVSGWSAGVSFDFLDQNQMRAGQHDIDQARAQAILNPPVNTGNEVELQTLSRVTTFDVDYNTADWGMKYKPDPIEEIKNLKPGDSHRAVKITPIFNEDGTRGHLRAIDPMTGKAKWSIPFKSPNWAGTLVTAGGLVFTGTLTGEFIAVDSDAGKILWQFQTPSGIIGQPVTWERDGKQYVTVTSGTGGVYVLKTPDPNLVHVPPGGTLWTFRLMDQ